MSEIINFNFENKKVRSLLINDKPYFVGKDVAIILGYSKPRNAIQQHVDQDDALKQGIIDNLGRTQNMTVINESGLYSLILSSKLPKAKEFKRWVTSEVLPSIRKTGSYGQHEKIESLLNNMIDLSKEFVVLTKSISDMCMAVTETVDKLVKQQPTTTIQESSNLDCSRCKLDSFPENVKVLVNSMMEEMINQEQLNFSAIARICVANGCNITSPSVKTYYEKHFKRRENNENS